MCQYAKVCLIRSSTLRSVNKKILRLLAFLFLKISLSKIDILPTSAPSFDENNFYKNNLFLSLFTTLVINEQHFLSTKISIKIFMGLNLIGFMNKDTETKSSTN